MVVTPVQVCTWHLPQPCTGHTSWPCSAAQWWQGMSRAEHQEACLGVGSAEKEEAAAMLRCLWLQVVIGGVPSSRQGWD